MKTLIIGATGKVGGFALESALNRGHHVRAFGRSTDNIDRTSDYLETFKGDVTSYADVSRAVAGREVVILAFGAPMNFDNLIHVPSVCEDGTRNVVKAMQSHGVRRLICMTMIGAGDSRNHGRFIFRDVILPVMLGRIVEDRNAQEDVVRNSELDWTIVRPTELTDDAGAGGYRVIEDLEGVTAKKIAREDVGHYLILAAEAPALIGKTHLITD